MSALLKLVQPDQFNEELALPEGSEGRGSHSLQKAFHYCAPWKPYIARYVIERFSKRGGVVLDPFCSTGITGIEGVLLGRSFIGTCDQHGLVKLSRARLFPADIAEVALRMQFVPIKRPVDLACFNGGFQQFFDAETFRELLNFKVALRGSTDSASNFINFILTAILHGHTSAYVSSYSSPSQALTAQAQSALNQKRGNLPSYRGVSGRVLNKAAMLLQDGLPSLLTGVSKSERELFFADPAALDKVATAGVDLALIAPEQPGFIETGLQSWLRDWWLGTDVPRGAGDASASYSDSAEWGDRLNEVLLEAARVVKCGGRAVLRLGQGRIGAKAVSYRNEATSVIKSCLERYWRIEGEIAERYVSDRRNGGGGGSSSLSAELLVLRRK